jgi:hypothetical protein
VEPDESFTIALANPTAGAALGTASFTHTIVDDDNATVKCQETIAATVAAASGTTTALVEWTALPNALEYEVRYGLVVLDPSQWASITVAAPASSVELSGLLPNSQYRYQVRFRCDNNNLFTGWSNAVLFSTNWPSLSCPVPTGTSEGVITATSGAVSWNSVANAGAYQVEIKESSASTWDFFIISGTSYVFPWLDPNTSYDWRVRARCGTPVSAYSAVRSFTTGSAIRVGDEGLSTTGLTLYPNPTQGALTLQFQSTAESTEVIRVLDVAGRVVFVQALQTVEGRNEVALDLATQPAGVYFVQALGQTAKVVLAK